MRIEQLHHAVRAIEVHVIRTTGSSGRERITRRQSLWPAAQLFQHDRPGAICRKPDPQRVIRIAVARLDVQLIRISRHHI